MPRPPRVLVVDDEPQVLEVLTEFLTLHGYEALTAENAGDALMLLTEGPPDVVLLDIGMPHVDGVAALRRIRLTHPDMPVVMLTGNADVDLARETLRRGAFDYVAKPVDLAHLANVLEAALAHRGR